MRSSMLLRPATRRPSVAPSRLAQPKFPQIPAEVIPTIVEFWAHAGDYCMTFGPAALVRRGLEQIAARVATMNIS